MNNQTSQLEDILENLKNDKEIAPSAAFRTNARIRILNTVTYVPVVPQVKQHGLGLRVFAFRFAVLIIFLLGGTVYAAQSANPRGVLFPVKILSERTALVLSPTESIKTSVAATIISRRAEENISAKKDGNTQEVQETVVNFESTVSQIRKTGHINQDRIEQEIEKHAVSIRENSNERSDEATREDGDTQDVKGEHTELKSSINSFTGTPEPTKAVERQEDTFTSSPELPKSESSGEGDSGHDVNEDTEHEN